MKPGGLKALVIGPVDHHDPEAEGDDGPKSEKDYRDKLVPIAQTILDAVKADDAEALADALADAHAVCGDYVEGDEPGDEE